jgi:small subunit ribosomal protein S4
MARDLEAKCRKCRREGEKLFLKGTRCHTHRCAFDRRDFAPGQHGAKRTKLSNYGMQLREKQKTKRMYGLLEKQFRLYFHKATQRKGVTGTLLLQFLERRLDNVVFRMGFASTRTQARQFVGHGLVRVNDRSVNIPSFLIKPNDEVSMKIETEGKKLVKENLAAQTANAPLWLSVDADHMKGKVVRMPERDDISAAIKEQLIVELYSR